MSFNEAVATLPDAIRLWVLWLTIIMLATPALMVVWRQTRRPGLIVAGANLAVIVTMQALFAAVGFVRLLGLPHVVIWTPLAIYLALQLRRGSWPTVPRIAAIVFLVSICVSLLFDYADVIRWLMGERGVMTGAAAR